MKKKLQKYLSGSNEGFSLVELIIVIAIMAILIGVVALAVIPYLEKSRESKDLQALSTLSGALSTAVADVKATGTGTFDLTIGSSITRAAAPATDQDKVLNAVADSIGDAKVDLGSTAATGTGAANKVTCYYDTSKNVVAVYVKEGTTQYGTATQAPDSNNVQNCKYNDNAPLMVSNGASAGAGAGAGAGGGTP